MLVSVFLALFLPCAGMSVVFVVYSCILCFTAGDQGNVVDADAVEMGSPVKQSAAKGLSAEELEKLPKVSGKELVMGSECAVCLEDIDADKPVRLVPGCNHGFHLHCADTWLSKNPVCPVCRARLGPELFCSSHHCPC